LILTLDDLESHIIVNVSSTLTNTTIWFVAAMCLIVDVRTYGRTDVGLLWTDGTSTDISPNLPYRHANKMNAKTQPVLYICLQTRQIAQTTQNKHTPGVTANYYPPV